MNSLYAIWVLLYCTVYQYPNKNENIDSILYNSINQKLDSIFINGIRTINFGKDTIYATIVYDTQGKNLFIQKFSSDDIIDDNVLFYDKIQVNTRGKYKIPDLDKSYFLSNFSRVQYGKKPPKHYDYLLKFSRKYEVEEEYIVTCLLKYKKYEHLSWILSFQFDKHTLMLKEHYGWIWR